MRPLLPLALKRKFLNGYRLRHVSATPRPLMGTAEPSERCRNMMRRNSASEYCCTLSSLGGITAD
jgi:hypothetical protein